MFFVKGLGYFCLRIVITFYEVCGGFPETGDGFSGSTHKEKKLKKRR